VVEASAYKDAKKRLVLAIKTAKSKRWVELCAEVEHDPWGRPYRTVTKKLVRRRPIVGIELPGRLDGIIRELFPTDASGDSANVQWLFDPKDFTEFTVNELLEEASGLPNGKTPGPDGIHNEVLKAAVKANPQRFLQVYNQCITEAVYPAEWKRANLVLIPKSGKPPEAPSSYRPLCMLDTTGKLFEKLLVRRLKNHLSTTNALSDKQNGFRQGRSTLDSLDRLSEIIKIANLGASHRRKVVGMITLDVKNAFNSAQWSDIINALIGMSTPDYLISIIRSYLCNRSVTIHTPNGYRTIEVTRGVPQGSVLGPDLWNILYNSLLLIEFPHGIELLAFADDVAIVATAKTNKEAEEQLEEAFSRVIEWMSEHGLCLAVEKTEAVMFTNRKINNTMNLNLAGHDIPSARSIRYLGVQLDSKLKFKEHAALVAERASKVTKQLSIILLNLGGASEPKRRLLAGVVESILLYAAPFWVETAATKAICKLEAVHRRTLLRMVCGYRTASYTALAVIASTPPLHLLAEERRSIRRGSTRQHARAETITKWQRKWEAALDGRWTYRLIPDVKTWCNRNHGNVSFHMTQFLTGHGCFRAYLKRFNRSDTDLCPICEQGTDDAEHAVLVCDAWDRWRSEVCIYLGIGELTTSNIVATMLQSEYNWTKISNMVGRIMKEREAEERRRQRAPL